MFTNLSLLLLIFGTLFVALLAQDVELSSLSGPSSKGFHILGAAADDYSGWSVSHAGDVNGDGVADIIVGAYGADPPLAVAGGSLGGISYVIFGRKVGGSVAAFGDIQLTTGATAMPASVGFRILGAAPYDQSGYSVGAAGDVNGDGVDDVIVGAWLADSPTGGSDAGISYVIFGRNISGGAATFGDIQLTSGTNPMPTNIGFRILGAAVDDWSGSDVSAAGDVNGDGVDDTLVGAYWADPSAGSANAGISYVIFGRKVGGAVPAFGDIQLSTGATAMPASVGFRILGAAAEDRSGFSVNAAGDVNGDGVSDILVGAFWADPPISTTDAGISYVIFGRKVGGAVPAFGDIQLTTGATAIPASVGFRILGAASFDNSGYSVSAAGDVNGDGVDDVIVGAYQADPSAGKTDAGISYVIFGRRVGGSVPAFGDIQLTTGATAMPTSVGFRILGAATGDYSGWFVSAAGDVNGDGVDDVIIGARAADPLTGRINAGITYVILGRKVGGEVAAFGDIHLTTGATVMPANVGFRILGAATGDQCGVSVGAAGDVNAYRFLQRPPLTTILVPATLPMYWMYHYQ